MVEPLPIGHVERLRVNLLGDGPAGPSLDRRAAGGPGIGPADRRNRLTCLRRSGIGRGAGRCGGLAQRCGLFTGGRTSSVMFQALLRASAAVLNQLIQPEVSKLLDGPLTPDCRSRQYFY